MLPTKSEANPQNPSIDIEIRARDPLGLTPLPVESRQRYLRFSFSQKNEALIPLSHILEVMNLPLEDVLAVPDMPSCVLGVCVWQSETLWLIDLNGMMHHPPLPLQSQIRESPTVIVIQSQQKSLGLVVDSVGDIDLFDPSHIRMQVGICSPSLEPYVEGYCPDGVSTVLDVSRIFESPLLQPC